MTITSQFSEPTQLPLLPLRDVVVFPHMVIPLFVGRPKSIKALEAAMESERRIMLVAQKAASAFSHHRHRQHATTSVCERFACRWLSDW